MRNPAPYLLALLVSLSPALVAPAAHADMELLTPDGRRVLLRDDQTWDYLEGESEPEGKPELPPDHLKLRVENVTPRLNACRFGLRIANHLGYPLRTIVLKFSTFKTDGVLYDSVLREFSSVKPTDDQYREVTFKGLRCEEIDHIQLSGGERCSMGELNRFSGEEGECLSHVRIVPSEVVRLVK